MQKILLALAFAACATASFAADIAIFYTHNDQNEMAILKTERPIQDIRWESPVFKAQILSEIPEAKLENGKLIAPDGRILGEEIEALPANAKPTTNGPENRTVKTATLLPNGQIAVEGLIIGALQKP